MRYDSSISTRESQREEERKEVEDAAHAAKLKFVDDSKSINTMASHTSELLNVKEYVRTYLFKKKNFIVSDKELDFGKILQRVVCMDMGVHPLVQAPFWETHRENIRVALSNKRTSTASTIGKNVMGKLRIYLDERYDSLNMCAD
jgi:hypothetical protein